MNRLIIDASNIISGGGLTHLKEFINHANPEEFGFNEVELWASKKSLNKLSDKSWLNKRTHNLLNKGYFSRFIWKHTVLKKSLDKKSVLFIPGTGYLKTKANVVTMCQNLLPLEKDEMNRFYPSLIWLRLLLLRYLHLKSYRKSDGVIFLNKYCLEKTKTLITEINNARVIPHGVNNQFRYQRKDYKVKDGFNLLYVSSLNLYKQQWLIAKAVLELNREGVPVSLVLIGESYSSAGLKLKNIIDKYPAYVDSISWLGKIPYENLDSYYKEADAFIYGSTCETFGMTLLEAMASSLPIACSNKSSMKNLLKDAGIYFDPENVESIKDAIMKLYNSEKLRKEYGTKAYSLASEYDWENTVNLTLDYLSEIGAS